MRGTGNASCRCHGFYKHCGRGHCKLCACILQFREPITHETTDMAPRTALKSGMRVLRHRYCEINCCSRLAHVERTGGRLESASVSTIGLRSAAASFGKAEPSVAARLCRSSQAMYACYVVTATATATWRRVLHWYLLSYVRARARQINGDCPRWVGPFILQYPPGSGFDFTGTGLRTGRATIGRREGEDKSIPLRDGSRTTYTSNIQQHPTYVFRCQIFRDAYDP